MPGQSLDEAVERIVAGVKLASTKSRQFDGASQEPCSRYGLATGSEWGALADTARLKLEWRLATRRRLDQGWLPLLSSRRER